MHISFIVQGSAEEPYQVDFHRRSPDQLNAYCTCPAGENGQYCKHRFRIMSGIEDGVISNNVSDVCIVQTWLAGTALDKAMREMLEIEIAASEIKKKLSASKKKVAKAMRD